MQLTYKTTLRLILVGLQVIKPILGGKGDFYEVNLEVVTSINFVKNQTGQVHRLKFSLNVFLSTRVIAS